MEIEFIIEDLLARLEADPKVGKYLNKAGKAGFSVQREIFIKHASAALVAARANTAAYGCKEPTSA